MGERRAECTIRKSNAEKGKNISGKSGVNNNQEGFARGVEAKCSSTRLKTSVQGGPQIVT